MDILVQYSSTVQLTLDWPTAAPWLSKTSHPYLPPSKLEQSWRQLQLCCLRELVSKLPALADWTRGTVLHCCAKCEVAIGVAPPSFAVRTTSSLCAMAPKRKPRGAVAKKAAEEQQADPDNLLSEEYLARRQRLIADLEAQGACWPCSFHQGHRSAPEIGHCVLLRLTRQRCAAEATSA